ncbi:MAG TPA: M48 family metalloprotease [Coriobacteriia bacterium]|nr:M48 family metalloprotease [Coriobacteriia bacterium]
MSDSPLYQPRRDRHEPLWDRVDRNRVELAIFICVFVLVAVAVLDVMATVVLGVFGVMVMGSVRQSITLGQLESVFVGSSLLFLVLSLLWVGVSLRRPEKWVVKRFGAQFVPKGAELPTKMALKDMAIAGGLPMAPALYLLPQSSVNAFVFATGRRRAVCGVTRGFIDKLSVDEQRAVFANLVARLIAGDTYTAAGIASIVWPMYAWDDAMMEARNAEIDAAFISDRRKKDTSEEAAARIFFGVAFAILSSLFEAWHRRKQRAVSEKADAEGMLLLKDPRSMVSALERCIELDNTVPTAGEAFADLFFCWTGPARNDHTDPEWRRVARLREVLGVEGARIG